MLARSLWRAEDAFPPSSFSLFLEERSAWRACYRYIRVNEASCPLGKIADKSKGINIRRRNSSLSAADLALPVKR
jgi:hypothetical protein